MTKTIRVAIDGPSGAGKSTLARSAAARLNFLYVDTGAIYRTIGYQIYTQGLDPAGFAPGCDADERWYPEKDYHTMYVAEIEAVYQKTE